MTSDSLSPRAARTRSALLAAGLDLVAERPIDAIAIDELVSTAGVGKGSFFNHFVDKQRFAEALADNIRRDIEARVAATHAGVADPLERLARGMIATVAFTQAEPKRTVVLVRTWQAMTLATHPLNEGVRKDMRAAVAAEALPVEAERAGVIFYLGCCQALMSVVAQQRWSKRKTVELLADMLALALRGIGAGEKRVAALADPVWIAACLTNRL